MISGAYYKTQSIWPNDKTVYSKILYTEQCTIKHSKNMIGAEEGSINLPSFLHIHILCTKKKDFQEGFYIDSNIHNYSCIVPSIMVQKVALNIFKTLSIYSIIAKN